MIRIALDADGPIFNFLDPFKEIATEVTGRKIKRLNKSWSLSERYGLTNNEVKLVFDIFNQNGLWNGLPLMEDADRAIHDMVNVYKADILVVSSMPLEQVQNRVASLRRNNINLPVVAVGVGNKKTDVYKRFKPDYVIDDYVNHLNEAKLVGVKNRVLINGCEHDEDTASATEIYNSLFDFSKNLTKVHHEKVN